ncbi:unnamed protein product [Rhizopus stolonifer]
MTWGRIEKQAPIIVIDPTQTNKITKSLLAPPPLAYDSPLLSTQSFSSSTSSLNSVKTNHIGQLEFFDIAIVNKQMLQIEELRQDIITLNQKYVQQIEKFQEAEQQKVQFEHELEDLSRNLFEQANAMVSKEKKTRFLVEQKLIYTQRELNLVREELENERAQFKELRSKLEGQIDNSESCKETDTVEIVDRGWLDMFKDFIKAAPNTPLDLLHRLSFLKLCFTMDVQPCLRSGIGFSRLTLKRLLESVIHQSCFIERTTPFQLNQQESVRRPSFVARFRPAPGTQCYGCNSKIDKQTEMFRFKLKEQDTDWQYIDKACRNRLVAVCDFYAFVRHVQLGLQAARTAESLFEECFKLRLTMFYARSGTFMKR